MNVLLIEDDADIRDLVVFKLQRAGFTVRFECNGEAGLAAALENPPGVILLDMMMPKLTGIEVCQRLREEPSTKDAWIVLMTAKSQEADINRGFAAGANDYIAKPFSPRELISKVETAMNR